MPENINLVHNDYETSIPLSALNVNFDVDSAVNYAYQIGKSGNIFENSRAIGKVNKAIIAIEDKNFAEAIKNKLRRR